MITEEYCSFETTQLLKGKGFDCECNAYYRIPIQSFSRDSFSKCLNVLPKNWNKCCEQCVVYEYISMPTQSLVLKWLREVYQLIITIDYDRYESEDDKSIVGYGYNIQTKDNPEDYYQLSESVYDTYEEAVEAALKYTLENLI